jgi:hypothetical protein
MKSKWLIALSELGVYLATLFGVLFSRYLPEMARAGDVSRIVLSRPGIGEIILACVVAALVTHIVDSQGDKDGKMRAIKRRLFSAFASGVMWFQLMQVFLKG